MAAFAGQDLAFSLWHVGDDWHLDSNLPCKVTGSRKRTPRTRLLVLLVLGWSRLLWLCGCWRAAASSGNLHPMLVCYAATWDHCVAAWPSHGGRMAWIHFTSQPIEDRARASSFSELLCRSYWWPPQLAVGGDAGTVIHWWSSLLS